MNELFHTGIVNNYAPHAGPTPGEVHLSLRIDCFARFLIMALKASSSRAFAVSRGKVRVGGRFLVTPGPPSTGCPLTAPRSGALLLAASRMRAPALSAVGGGEGPGHPRCRWVTDVCSSPECHLVLICLTSRSAGGEVGRRTVLEGAALSMVLLATPGLAQAAKGACKRITTFLVLRWCSNCSNTVDLCCCPVACSTCGVCCA